MRCMSFVKGKESGTTWCFLAPLQAICILCRWHPDCFSTIQHSWLTESLKINYMYSNRYYQKRRALNTICISNACCCTISTLMLYKITIDFKGSVLPVVMCNLCDLSRKFSLRIYDNDDDNNCNAMQLEDHTTSCRSFWPVFDQICTANAQKLPFLSFWSKFWHHH